jgi:hypothetical protein
MMKPQLAAIVCSLVFISAKCHKDKDMAIDPCKDKTAFKADFTIEEKVGDTSFVSNSVLAPGYVFFKAKGTYDSIRWLIGGPQNTSTNRNHVLYFQQAEGNLEVSMIGYRKPNTTCFPNEKAIDTVKKTINIVKRDQYAAIVGRFVGYTTNSPTDTFSVLVNADNSAGIWQYYVKNLPKNCPGYIQVSDGYPRNIGLSIIGGYAAFGLSNTASTVCASINGYGYLKNNDTLIINYSAIPMSSEPPYSYGERSNFTFIGVRKP